MASPTHEDILNLTHEIQMDLRAANSKMTTVRSWLAAQPTEKRKTHLCPNCGLDLGGERTLAFHLQNVHDGPAVPLSESEAAA